MTSVTVKALRAASIGICLVVAVSFLLFAVDQTSTASGHQQEVISEKTPAQGSSGPGSQTPSGQSSAPPAPAPAAGKSHEHGFRKSLDEAASELTSPVSGVASGNSEWAEHSIRLVFALLVYGFGLGYLARTLRVR